MRLARVRRRQKQAVQLGANADCWECSGGWRCGNAVMCKRSPSGLVCGTWQKRAANAAAAFQQRRQPAADAAGCRAPAGEGTCCTNEARQGWSAVQGKC